MEIFLTQSVNGIIIGAGYALIAAGWTILLGVARLVNFSYGQTYMVSGFVTWGMMTHFGIPYFAAIPIALASGAVLGLIMQAAVMTLTLDQNIVSLLLVTLAFGYFLEGGASYVFGVNPQVINTPLLASHVHIGSAIVTMQDVFVVVVVVVLYALIGIVMTWTRVGRIVRGVSNDPKLAQLYGINPKLVYLGVFAFSSAVAALGGSIVAPSQGPILTSMGFSEVIIVFLVVVLGGIGSLSGSLVVGIGLGLFTAFFDQYVGSAYVMAVAFGVLFVVLAVRPEGLMKAR
jgi:branched-chain amino acid transport system permease protein